MAVTPAKVKPTPKHQVGIDPRHRDQYAVYGPGTDALVYKLRLAGYIDTEIVAALGISLAKFKAWLAEYPTLAEKYLEGKDIADGNVASALYRRAVGDRIHVTKPLVVGNSIEYAEYERDVLPDVTAQKYWLAARRGWGDRVEVTGADGGPVLVQSVSYVAVANGSEATTVPMIVGEVPSSYVPVDRTPKTQGSQAIDEEG